MALRKALYQGWQWIREALIPDHQQRLLMLLRQQYTEEMRNVTQLTQYAQRMHYPQFREQLLQITRENQAQIHWLREKILGLGGDLLTVSCIPWTGKNSWECLRLALEEKKRSYATLLECSHQADRTDPTIAAELRRWRTQAEQHCDEIMSMLMKSDPSALPPPLTPRQEQQRQEWLARQKIAWLDQERARWEAGGKQVPWAEWVGERELQWMTELPHRELEWALHHNGKDAETFHTAMEGTPARAQESGTRRTRVSTLPTYHTARMKSSSGTPQKRIVTNADSGQIRTETLTRGGKMRTA
jgi:hypothetical protein